MDRSDRVDWSAEASRTYGKRWGVRRSTTILRHRFSRTARISFRRLMVLLPLSFAFAYLAAGGIHISNGWNFSESARLLVMDTRVAITCYQDPLRVMDFVQLPPKESVRAVLFAGYLDYETVACDEQFYRNVEESPW